MKIVVTGGAGFIGSHLTENLLKNEHHVTIIDNSLANFRRNITVEDPKYHKNLEFSERDIRYSPLNPIIKNADIVIHLAALADIVPSIENPTNYFETNVGGTLRVLEACRRSRSLKKFIYAASSSCYGNAALTPISKTMPINPEYPYALTKLMGEQLVHHWGKVYGIPWISLRLFNVYGPRSRTNGTYGAVFGTFLAQKLAGKPFTVVGDGTQSRDFIYVSDVVNAIEAAMHTDYTGKIYNVGTGKPETILKLTKLLGGEAIHIPERPGEPKITQANITKIKTELGWEPKVSFEDGVAIMLKNIDYWRKAPVWTPETIAKATKEWFNHLGDQ